MATNYTTNMVLYYNMSDNVIDSSPGGRNTGNLTGPDYVTNGYITGGLWFNNATNDYIVVNNSVVNDLDNMAELTINLWLNQTTRGSYLTRIVHMNGVYSLTVGYDTINEVRWRVYNSSGGTVEMQANAAVSYNVWQMITVTYKSGNMSIYYDGVLKNSTATLKGSVRDLALPLFIGIDEDKTTQEYLGYMDELSIYNKSYNNAEVYEMYLAYVAGNTTLNNTNPPTTNQCIYSGTGNFIQNNTVCNITTNVTIESNYNWIIQNSTVWVRYGAYVKSAGNGWWHWISGVLHFISN